MPGTLVPLRTDPVSARELGIAAAEARAGGNAEDHGWLRSFVARLEAGTVDGRLYTEGGRPTGFVSWSVYGPLGLSVELLYVAPTSAGLAAYAAMLAAVEAEAGVVAFAPGALAGVGPRDEQTLMRSLGFRRYGRSEMVWRGEGPPPEPGLLPSERLRPVDPADLAVLAELHRRAYQDRFDRYLFLENPDDASDARREVREILEGRWGEFSPTGSWILEQDGQLAGAVLAVQGGSGTLIADVMVAPDLQGRGVGRRVLLATLRALVAAGERRIYLNVTEGNERALRLYQGLGFVRSLGPTRDWYNARRIPVPPSPEA